MPKVYSSKKVLQYFVRIGCVKVSQKGSHLKMKTAQWAIFIVPMHSKDIPYGTFRAIIEQAWLDLRRVTEELGK